MIALALTLGFLAGLCVLYAGLRWQMIAGFVAAAVVGAGSIAMYEWVLPERAGSEWITGFGIGLALAITTMRYGVQWLVDRTSAAKPPARFDS